MPEANFTDARGVDAAIARLRAHVEGSGSGGGDGDGRRFFWAVGLRKPHLDWAVPKEFLDRQAAQEGKYVRLSVCEGRWLNRVFQIDVWINGDRPVPPHTKKTDIVLPPRDQRLAPYGQPPVAWWNCSSEEDWPKQLPPLSPVEPLPDDLTQVYLRAWVHTPPTPSLDQPIPTSTNQELRRAYLSAVSWADHQLGRLLDALESLGLAESTAIVLHADHGFHLGDSGEWCKMTTAEVGTRVPLLVALPPRAGDNATTEEAGLLREEIVELVDVMPTLLDVAGLSLPDPTLRGRSLLPLLLRAPSSSANESSMRKFEMAFDDADDPEGLRRLLQEALPAEEARAIVAQGAAFSQFPRCRSKRGAPPSLAGEGYAWNGQCIMYGNSHIAAMGYAVRVHGWRYAEWYAFDARTWLPRWNETGGLLGAELYNMDDDENGGRELNLAGEEPAVARALGYLLQKHFWQLLRPRREGERDMSAAVAATRWASPAPPGRGDAVGVDEGDLKEAWGDLWRDDGPVASVTAVARV